MNTRTLETSSRFLRAAASYFGAPPDQLVLGGMQGQIGGTINITFCIALTPADLQGIAKRMQEMPVAGGYERGQEQAAQEMAPTYPTAAVPRPGQPAKS